VQPGVKAPAAAVVAIVMRMASRLSAFAQRHRTWHAQQHARLAYTPRRRRDDGARYQA
jgi:hypothetical protein